jgi:hypothetical protein
MSTHEGRIEIIKEAGPLVARYVREFTPEERGKFEEWWKIRTAVAYDIERDSRWEKECKVKVSQEEQRMLDEYTANIHEQQQMIDQQLGAISRPPEA